MVLLRKQLFLLISAFLIFSGIYIYTETDDQSLPPKEELALERLKTSTRHGEWITYPAGRDDKVRAWVVYPEIKEKAPVVIVIHEIFGLTDWARAVADQFAKEGFIAIAPDLISGKASDGKGSESVDKDAARALIGALDPAEVTRRINGAADYATGLASAEKKYAIVGYCWGGAVSFRYATEQPKLSASVVYYGTSPETAKLTAVKAPVLGLYGGKDNRVNATIEAAENELKLLKKTFEKEIYEGAGHAFLRQQDGMEGANLAAAKSAWPRTIEFLKKAFKLKTAGLNYSSFTVGKADIPSVICHDE